MFLFSGHDVHYRRFRNSPPGVRPVRRGHVIATHILRGDDQGLNSGDDGDSDSLSDDMPMFFYGPTPDSPDVNHGLSDVTHLNNGITVDIIC